MERDDPSEPLIRFVLLQRSLLSEAKETMVVATAGLPQMVS
jgi:hypothetical protein